MKYTLGRTVVISLGGSVLCPDSIDVTYIKHLRKLILKFIRRNRRFIIVTGGGRICRVYQKAAEDIAGVTDEDKDWIGIHSTRLHAHLMRTAFRKEASPVVIDSRHRITKLKYPVTIASGWRPGRSTDYIAVQLAADFAVPEVVIAGKPDHVYDRDHQRHFDARPFEVLAWKKYRRIVPSKWSPGMHAPVDPVAAKLAGERRIKAIVVNGRDMRNMLNLLTGRDFKGTIIE